MNTTLSMDDQLAQHARESFIQAGPTDLEQPAGSTWRGQQLAEFEARCLQSRAQLGGWRFDRDQANER